MFLVSSDAAAEPIRIGLLIPATEAGNEADISCLRGAEVFQRVRKSVSLEREKVIRALEELTFRTPVGPMTIRKSDRRVLWPIWAGITQESSRYPFTILEELKGLGPDPFSPR